VQHSVNFQLECLSFAKEIRDLVHTTDSNKQLRSKLERYLDSVDSSLTFKTLGKDYFQD